MRKVAVDFLIVLILLSSKQYTVRTCFRNARSACIIASDKHLQSCGGFRLRSALCSSSSRICGVTIHFERRRLPHRGTVVLRHDDEFTTMIWPGYTASYLIRMSGPFAFVLGSARISQCNPMGECHEVARPEFYQGDSVTRRPLRNFYRLISEPYGSQGVVDFALTRPYQPK